MNMTTQEQICITRAGLLAVVRVVSLEEGYRHHRCGYVAVPKGHPLFGEGYDDVSADVHGGLTYASEGTETYPIPSADYWWFGFDCAHCDDAPIDKSPMFPSFGQERSLAEQLNDKAAREYDDASQGS